MPDAGDGQIMKRRQIEIIYTVTIYLLTAMISSAVGILFLKYIGKLYPEFFYINLFRSTFLPLLLSNFLASIIFLLASDYHFRYAGFFESFVRSVKYNLIMIAIWAICLVLGKTEVRNSRYFFVFVFLFNTFLQAFVMHYVQRRFIRKYYKTKNGTLVGVLAATHRAEGFIGDLKKDWTRRIVGLALVDQKMEDTKGMKINGVEVVADRETFKDWVRSSALDEVFIIVDYADLYELIPDMIELETMGVRVLMNLPMLEELNQRFSFQDTEPNAPIITPEVRYMGSVPYLSLKPELPGPISLFVKRLVDIVGAIVGCAITLVLIVLVGIPILIEDGWPMFYVSERVGKNGRIFKMYKFRSMVKDADQKKQDLMDQNEVRGQMFKMENDPRITKVGRFIRRRSLDEWPQFFNVLKGDMSLVGTRPPTVDEYNHYSSYHKRRLSMKPGITGMWQVNGRSDVKDFEDVVRMDCAYIDNWSFELDIKILFKTVVNLFRRKNGAQ